ncbi:LOW QUALITY PROTEIN: protein phosphatase 1L-like [Lampetra planeri]
MSPHVSPCLPMSPRVSPHLPCLPMSPHVSPRLPVSPRISPCPLISRVSPLVSPPARRVSLRAGTTCVLAVESAGRLYVANVGDSRAVLCDAQGSAVALSHDHKPHQLKERQRIKRAGGFISYNGSWRVQGVLAMSRSLGDFPLKRMGVVTAEPDVTAVDLRATRPRFLLMASDGLWDAFGSQEAVAFVGERLGEPHLGAKSVALQAFYRGCPDNITVVVVRYRTPRARCHSRWWCSRWCRHPTAGGEDRLLMAGRRWTVA